MVMHPTVNVIRKCFGTELRRVQWEDDRGKAENHIISLYAARSTRLTLKKGGYR